MFDPKNIPDHIFRGYDLRGLVDKDLSEKAMEFLGRGYATFLSRRRINESVVGSDNRLTSDIYRKAFIRGLRDCGINVIDFGLGLSQIMYFAQYQYKSKGGCFITASHNPKEFNGMKLATGFSQTMVTEEIQEFKKITKSGKYIKAKKKGSYKKENVFPAYKADLLKRVSIGKKFRVVVDGCNAPGGLFVPNILREAGCQVVEQNCNLDGNFPSGNPDPTEKAVQERLAKGVIKAKADMGFSYDVDGDRMGIVDEEGNLIWNDTLVAIFAMDILDYLPGAKIIFNTLCSKQTPEVIKKSGGVPIMWLTGHSFIKAKVAEERAPFGGELSGHFFFVDNFYGHDDGAISALRILAYLARKKKTLSQIIAELPHYISSPEIKLGCPDKIKFQLIDKKITRDLKKLYPKAEYVDIDGIRFDTKTRMAIIRASQNGPYITVKYESKTKKEYEELKKQLREILHKYKEIDFASGVNTDALD
jgi:phosphomannomutase/phosphoglucomutase